MRRPASSTSHGTEQITRPVQIIGVNPRQERAKTGDFAEFLLDEQGHGRSRRSR